VTAVFWVFMVGSVRCERDERCFEFGTVIARGEP
jgi:hypothetical protein